MSSPPELHERKRGRPRSQVRRSTISAWVPTSDHDVLIRLANVSRMSVSEFVGRLVQRAVKDKRP